MNKTHKVNTKTKDAVNNGSSEKPMKKRSSSHKIAKKPVHVNNTHSQATRIQEKTCVQGKDNSSKKRKKKAADGGTTDLEVGVAKKKVSLL